MRKTIVFLTLMILGLHTALAKPGWMCTNAIHNATEYQANCNKLCGPNNWDTNTGMQPRSPSNSPGMRVLFMQTCNNKPTGSACYCLR